MTPSLPLKCVLLLRGHYGSKVGIKAGIGGVGEFVRGVDRSISMPLRGLFFSNKIVACAYIIEKGHIRNEVQLRI